MICSEAGVTLEKTPYNCVYFAKCSRLRNNTNGSFIFVVHPDSEEDLSPGEFSPRVPVPSTAKKGSAGARVPKEPAGFARAYDLGEKWFADYVKIYLYVQGSLNFTALFFV